MTKSAIRYLVLGIAAATAIATSVTVAATPDAAVVEQGQGQENRSAQGNANAQGPQLVCGTRDLDDATAEAAEDYARRILERSPSGFLTASHNIPVYFHVIRSSSGSGGVTSQQISDQMNVLNNAFAVSSFSFTLAAITTTNNDSWYTAGPSTPRGEEHEDCPAPGRVQRAQHLLEQHGRRPARVGDVPIELRLAAEVGRRGDPQRLVAWRFGCPVQPGRHCHPRGRPLDGPVSHVPGRV